MEEPSKGNHSHARSRWKKAATVIVAALRFRRSCRVQDQDSLFNDQLISLECSETMLSSEESLKSSHSHSDDYETPYIYVSSSVEVTTERNSSKTDCSNASSSQPTGSSPSYMDRPTSVFAPTTQVSNVDTKKSSSNQEIKHQYEPQPGTSRDSLPYIEPQDRNQNTTAEINITAPNFILGKNYAKIYFKPRLLKLYPQIGVSEFNEPIRATRPPKPSLSANLPLPKTDVPTTTFSPHGLTCQNLSTLLLAAFHLEYVHNRVSSGPLSLQSCTCGTETSLSNTTRDSLSQSSLLSSTQQPDECYLYSKTEDLIRSVTVGTSDTNAAKSYTEMQSRPDDDSDSDSDISPTPLDLDDDEPLQDDSRIPSDEDEYISSDGSDYKKSSSEEDCESDSSCLRIVWHRLPLKRKRPRAPLPFRLRYESPPNENDNIYIPAPPHEIIRPIAL